MGKIFYDMGVLSQAKVVECSATDMIGQYVGQTGPKVQKQMEKAMGKVLFIDEAYRLAEGGFATEAMDELVDCLTKPKYAGKLITILAGYDKDIDRLMSINPGLTSRFPESVTFKHLEPSTSLELLVKVLTDIQKRKKAPLDLSILTPPSAELYRRITGLFHTLSGLDSWGNARDVKFLAKGMFNTLISAAVPPVTNLVLTEGIITDIMEKTLKERASRNEAAGAKRFPSHLPFPPAPSQPQETLKAQKVHTPDISMNFAPPTDHAEPPTAPTIAAPKIEGHGQRLDISKKARPAEEPEDLVENILKAKRDQGVSDAVWEQLERDKHAMVAKEREFHRLQEEKRQEEKRIEGLKRAEKEAADEEERREREQERIAAELERRRKQEILAAIERAREREKLRQMKLRQMGPCPAGFCWIQQNGGYRCAGGSHWLSDAMLGI
jgi:flagellar biosynthesis GTPase FlhF